VNTTEFKQAWGITPQEALDRISKTYHADDPTDWTEAECEAMASMDAFLSQTDPEWDWSSVRDSELIDLSKLVDAFVQSGVWTTPKSPRDGLTFYDVRDDSKSAAALEAEAIRNAAMDTINKGAW
jgi:hypothetical protein